MSSSSTQQLANFTLLHYDKSTSARTSPCFLYLIAKCSSLSVAKRALALFLIIGGFLMSKETILVIDDEKEIRDLIAIYLKNEGYNVLQASNGEEGLDILRDHQVHLIVLDIMMPKLNGIEMCIKVREIAEMPIIMLSAKTQDMDKIMGLTTGADDYITKPFNPL